MGASLPTSVGMTPVAEPSRCYTATHHGVDLFVLNMAHTSPEEAIEIMREASAWISRQPPNSLRAYTDASGAVYSKESYAALKAFTIRNTPHILASAMIGADGLRAAALRGVTLVTGRTIRSFVAREEAWDWLASVSSSSDPA